jgi:hypothetical protein
MNAVQIMDPDNIVSGKFGRWGIYGENGVGKTFVARSIPPNLPTWVISADQENIKPLKGIPHIKATKINHWNDLGSILQVLHAGLLLPNGQPNPDVLSGKKPFFRVIMFDTWTRIQSLAVNKVIGYERLTPQQAMKFLEVGPKTPRGWEPWQQVGALAGEWMRYFEELPIHVLFLFQEGTREGVDENFQKVSKIGPDLTPSALRHAKDTLEVIGRLYVTLGQDESQDESAQEEKPIDLEAVLSGAPQASPWMDPAAREVRNLLIGKHPNYFAKGPTHKLGRIIPDFTFQHLLDSLEP